jgi:hypothetical protein
MRRIRTSAVLAVAVAAGALLCACGGRSVQHQAASDQPRGHVTNPSSFPLYPQSVVTTVVPVDTAQLFAAIRAADPKASLPPNFRGHEVIAETPATLKQLGAWIATLKKVPPRGLHEEKGDTTPRATSSPESDGGIGVQFATANGDRSVFLVAADPKRIREGIGPAFALIDSYTAVPEMVRGPIDQQAKQQLGYSVTEMLDAKSPIGAIIAEVKKLQNTDRRAIVVIDTSRAQ